MACKLEASRIRFEAAASHVHHAQQLREAGKVAAALKDLELAKSIDPASDIAIQELARTHEMLHDPTGPKTLTPTGQEKSEEALRIRSIRTAPELRLLSPQPINVKMTGKPKVLFDTIARLAGVNIIFDPDYETQNNTKEQTLQLTSSALQDALDYVSVLTKSFWKPLSANTLFVTLDNRQKRQDYEEQIVKVFYLINVSQQAELNEIVTLLRTVADIQKVFTSTPLNAVVVRAEADKVLLAEKLVAAVDEPKPEVVVDVMVMEVNRNYVRNLSSAFGASGINSSIAFTPRTSITGQSTSTSTTSTTTTTTTTAATNDTLSLAGIKHISTADYTISNVPGALVEALLAGSGTRVLQAPQIRGLDNFKSSLKVGDKVPTATGSYSAGTSSTSVNALVNTQFSYLDVGVNMDMTPRVHDAKEVSMHLVIEVSQVTGAVTIGGVDEPEIGQRKVELDLRLRDGEMNIIGGLTKEEEDKSISGIPGLSQIPLLKRLFSSESITRTQQELLITLAPHIIRSPGITAMDLRSAATGNATFFKLNTDQPASDPATGIRP